VSSTTKNTRIAFVGDFYTATDEAAGKAFFGGPGQELLRQLKEVNIDFKDCLFTNVFNLRPPNNDLRSFCISKAAAVYSYPGVLPRLLEKFPEFPWPQAYDFPALVGVGMFLHPEHLSHLGDLQRTLLAHDPALLIGMGNTAIWALFRSSGIAKLRGYTYACTFLPGGPRVLPTYHPSSVIRMYSNRPIVLADLSKARRLVYGATLSPGAILPTVRTLWLEPSLEDLAAWESHAVVESSTRISIDIETFGGTITCIGFGTKNSAICVPFWNRAFGANVQLDGKSYWPSQRVEVQALLWVRRILESPNPKVLQNAQYDLQYLWKTWGMVPKGTIHDTMLMAHALQPEMEKSLGFLGSTYTDVPAWKHLRKLSDARAKMEKKDA
jgi:uracil-DNA glycosylase